MYGLLYASNSFFSLNKKDILEDEMVIKIQDYLKKNIFQIFTNFLQLKRGRPVSNVSWFTIELSDVWNGINTDFSEFLTEQYPEQEEKEDFSPKGKETRLKVLYTRLRSTYIKNLFQKAFDIFSGILEKNYLNREGEDSRYSNAFFRFFPSLFYGTSGLAEFDLMDGLIMETFDEEIDPLGTILGLWKGDVLEKKGLLQLIMVGFEMIEADRNDRVSNAEKRVEDILEEM